MDKKSTFKTGLVVGAILGGITAFFLSPKSGKENRELAKKKFDQLRNMMKDKNIDEIVAEIYGKASDEGKKLYTKARKELDAKLEDLNDTIGDIDQKKYISLVEEVMDHIKNETEATKDRVTKLQSYLVNRWEQAQEMAQEDVEKVADDVEKKLAKKR
ncbi:MAG TPA: YtxH domain-containing protein [Candidatus Woesebacteria bacterium]|nr:YtxH domain-containing protein [Candidatus Woesebacteria bacterium]